MKNAIRKTGWILLGLFLLLQLFRPPKNKSKGVPETDIRNIYEVPPAVQAMLTAACYDCHSNNTRYPWYTAIQPFGWWIDKHIRKGKEDLNFSEFGAYSQKRRKNKLRSIVEQVKEDKMPLPAYKRMHSGAALDSNQKAQLIAWSAAIIQLIEQQK